MNRSFPIIAIAMLISCATAPKDEITVIGTKGTDIWRELEKGGAIIADRTPDAFADAIEDLVSDKEVLKAKGQQGREHILSWLDNDSVAKRYEEMYGQAANGHQS